MQTNLVEELDAILRLIRSNVKVMTRVTTDSTTSTKLRVLLIAYIKKLIDANFRNEF